MDLPLAGQSGQSAAERLPFLCGYANSLRCSLAVLSDEKAAAPLVHSTCRHRDRVLGAAKIVAKLAVSDVAQDRSLVQLCSSSDLGRFKKLFDRREREYNVE